MRYLLFGVCLGIGCAEGQDADPSLARSAGPEEEEDDGRSRFGFPVADPSVISDRVGVDHDPEDLEGVIGGLTCTDYLGRTFPHCYDEHHGTDFILDGGFDAMDAGSVEVLAAFRGVVIQADDGNYDRCHGEISGVNCDGNPMVPNMVEIEHEDGLRSRYLHLKRGSVRVEVGQEIACGEVLGLVGSSGNSSMPHLHFSVELPDDQWIDPYAGPYSQPESLWEDQGAEDGLPEAGCTSR